MTDKTYNGWPNWETWQCTVYLGDELTRIAENNRSEADVYIDFKDYIKGAIWDSVGGEDLPSGIGRDFICESINQIDMFHLAETFWADAERD